MFSLLLIGKCLEIYDNLDNKLRETINYLIVGGLTTLISIIAYNLFRYVISDITICTILSWIVAVAFAYICNRIIVFQSTSKKYIKEITSFVCSRLFSLLVEIVLMLLLVNIFTINDRIAKIFVQIVIIILNYITSKVFVFKKK